jgi:hypothetical protein
VGTFNFSAKYLLKKDSSTMSENGRVAMIEPEMIGDLLICIFKMAAQREFVF